MARPADFSRKLQFRYYPAQSIYQRPGQAIFSKSRLILSTPGLTAVLATLGPMAVFQVEATVFSSKSRPNGRFINARPNGRNLFSAKAANGCFINAKLNGFFINARPNGRFIKAETTDGQTSTFQPQIAISLLSRTINLSAAVFSKSRPNGRCINGRSNGRFINARPNGRFIKAKATEGTDIRFALRAANSILSRTISLSAANCRFIPRQPVDHFIARSQGSP